MPMQSFMIFDKMALVLSEKVMKNKMIEKSFHVKIHTPVIICK